MKTDILSELIIKRVCAVSTLYNPEGTHLKRMNRKMWAVVIKYEGETVYTAGGKSFPSDANHVVILPGGCTYEWQCKKSGHYSIMEFESDAIYSEPISLQIKSTDRILRMLKDLEAKRNSRKITTGLESIRDAYSILLTIIQAENERYLPSRKQELIEPAIEYISSHYTESITNDMLAEMTGLSNVYFRKLFTDICGVSPMVYIGQLRIQKAKEMLGSDYSTVSDIAQLLGYPSLYDFSRSFKKYTGISPSKYSREIKIK